MIKLQLAGGSIVGRDHVDIPQNNQDAYKILVNDDLIVAIICDGCGDRVDSVASELGSRLAVNILTYNLMNHAIRKGFNSPNLTREAIEHPGFWERVRQDALAKIRVIALEMGESFSEVIQSYFLFTTIGVLITPSWSCFFSIGDGLIAINNEFQRIGPFPDNQPPYMAYALSETGSQNPAFRFSLQSVIRTSSIDNFLLGSDGAVELSEIAHEKMPDGSDVGFISQYWEEDKFFRNPDMVRRRLKLINSERVKVIPNGVIKRRPLLSDDTTIIVGRRF